MNIRFMQKIDEDEKQHSNVMTVKDVTFCSSSTWRENQSIVRPHY